MRPAILLAALGLAATAAAAPPAPAADAISELPVVGACEGSFLLVGYCAFACLPGNLITVEGRAGGFGGIAQVRVEGDCGGERVVCTGFVQGFSAECARTGGPTQLPGVGLCEGSGWLGGNFRCRAHAAP